ncbi:MAG: hypothetical protein WD398_15245 [Cyclobacteriaceae bacterium]
MATVFHLKPIDFTIIVTLLVGWIHIGAVTTCFAGLTFFQEPSLEGPDAACLNGAFVYANFSAGGDPATDRYIWSITDGTGFEIFYQSGGQDVASITFPFTSTGTFNVSLRVIRGGNQNYYSHSKTVVVERGPSFVLPPDVIFCGSEPVHLQALDANDPNLNQYTIEWLNPANTVLGTGNTFMATEPGRYYAKASSVACEAVASTYVGPSIQVEVNASGNIACLGDVINYVPDIPISAEWSYQRDDQVSRTTLGKSFELNLNTDNLQGLGSYTVFFNAEDLERPGCSVEKSFDLQVRAAPDFSLVKMEDATSCSIADGSFEIRANSDLETVTITDIGSGAINDMSANTVSTINNLAPKVYAVTASVGTCSVTKTINILNDNPNEGIDFKVSSVPQSCSPAGAVKGSLNLDFNGISTSGGYRIISDDGQVYQANFQNETRITVSVPKSTYQIEVNDDSNCSSTSSQTYPVEGSSQVNFSIPANLTICQTFDLTPESNQDLGYSLTGPNGSEINPGTGGAFTLNESGEYRMVGVHSDPNSPLCPRTRTFQVTVNEPLAYDYSKRIIDCFGNQIFSAELSGINPNSVTIRWMRENRVIVGREIEFFPPNTGTFLLEVQPRASSNCPVNPIAFEVVIPENTAEISLEGSPFCGNSPFTELTMVSDSELIQNIEWYKKGDQGEDILLLEWENQTSIEVKEEGIYEVVVRNEINCRLASAQYEVKQFETVPVNIADTYELCTAENIRPSIQPGEAFVSYSWYFNGELVSEENRYVPDQSGNYELIVMDTNGCEQVNEFEVIEECAILLRFPNALVLGDPQRDFKVYADPEIEWIEIYIFNRTGEMIFHCQSNQPDATYPVCQWDGMLNGRKIIPGTYPVRIHYKSEALGVDKVENKSILIIDN